MAEALQRIFVLTSVIPGMGEHDSRCGIEFLNVQYQIDEAGDIGKHVRRARGNEQHRQYQAEQKFHFFALGRQVHCMEGTGEPTKQLKFPLSGMLSHQIQCEGECRDARAARLLILRHSINLRKRF